MPLIARPAIRATPVREMQLAPTFGDFIARRGGLVHTIGVIRELLRIEVPATDLLAVVAAANAQLGLPPGGPLPKQVGSLVEVLGIAVGSVVASAVN